jgi:hypothetical protein
MALGVVKGRIPDRTERKLTSLRALRLHLFSRTGSHMQRSGSINDDALKG